ncbi:MAG: AAA family ATPase, partial [Leptospiraceae bacterium]|nr:AAA family ATPase [Leptospiraceae bacterium]
MEFTDQAANLRKLAYSRNEAGVAVLEPEAQPNENIAETPEATEDIATSQETATRVIAVTSGKGGVGKSTLSVNLAISIARMGKKVLLFDGDLGLANVNVLMGIIPEHSIYEVIKGKKKIEDIIISTSYGIDIIAGANGISQLANLTEAQRDEFMSAFGAVGGYDVMLIDT